MTKTITIKGKTYIRAKRTKSGRKDIKQHALKLRKTDKKLSKKSLSIHKASAAHRAIRRPQRMDWNKGD
jgi:hypothetical protein